jgi:hypothetical protein
MRKSFLYGAGAIILVVIGYALYKRYATAHGGIMAAVHSLTASDKTAVSGEDQY